MNLPAAIASLRPGAEWTLADSSDLASLVWLSGDVDRPTDAEIIAEAERLDLVAAEPPTAAEKLAAAGLSVEDLKAVLGLA